MEQQYQKIAAAINQKARETSRTCLLVAIAGPPGSGKTTIASRVVDVLNSPDPAIGDDGSVERTPTSALAVPMDGFHLPRSVLDQLPNRAEAYVRRGAPWTFDAEGSLKFVEELQGWAKSGHADETRLPIYAPSFDHAVKDPVERGIAIHPSTTIVVLEGLYLLLDEPYWQQIAALVDVKIFVDVEEEDSRMRLARRHVAAGIVKNIEDAVRRVDTNDTPNGRLIREKAVKPFDIVVRSVHDQRLDSQ